jgi:hypothetical protein
MSENNFAIEGYTKKRLYDLIPAVYRQRDAKLVKPLEDLIGIIAEHTAALEKDIGGLNDNWFIQTCQEWATWYIADLVGAKSLTASKVSSLSTTEEVSQRAYVANTIAYRRRKGTILMLEELAADITGWGAKAVEFFKLLGTTQNVNHIRLAQYETPDLRNTSKLELLNTPFDTIAHTVEVRRIRSNRGLYNIPNVGIFLWRLQAFLSSNTPASPFHDPAAVDKSSTRTFRFNQLGYDAPIFNSLDDDPNISEMAQEHDLPVPIRRRALYDSPDKYYGKDLSIFLQVKYKGESEYREVATREIQVCNLEKWAKPSPDRVAIDPENGRISLPKEATDLRVIYYYGFSGKIGGGFYKRRPTLSSTGKLLKISKSGDGGGDHTTIQAAIDAWEQDGYGDVVFEIQDSEIYDEALVLALPVGCKVAVVAAQEQTHEERPILRSLTVQGESGSDLTLDGLWFNNNPSNARVIRIRPGDMASIAFRHCTIVPCRDTHVRKVAVGLTSYIRRRICMWEKIITNQSHADRLKEFLKKNFAGWITDAMEFKKVGAGKEIVTLSDMSDSNEKNNSLTVTLDQERPFAHLDVTTGGEEEKNVYEFIVLTDSGKRNLYVKGGNDDLQISLDRTITGRVQIVNSLIFTWDRIPAKEDDKRHLRTFLKSNFYLPWLTKATPFEKDVTGDVISAKSVSGNNSLTITLQGSKAVLKIFSKDADGNKERDKYEFVVRENRVYNQSDAHLSAADSIIDGKGDNEAIEARSVRLENTTVFGKTRVSKLNLASNVIFTDIVSSTITQEGCVRFSYIPPGSKTPQRYLCQPEEGNEEEPTTVSPAFTSEIYGDPGYAQLHKNISAKIFQGGDNGAEMGAFNHLLQPQRIADLKSSIDEYLRFGLEAGVFLVT